MSSNEQSVKAVNEYILWRRDREMYPPRLSPEEWIEDVLKSEARVRLNLLSDYLLTIEQPDSEALLKIHELVFDPLEVIVDDAGV